MSWPGRCPPGMIDVDERGTRISSGPLPLHNRVMTRTILPRFEDHHVLNGRDVEMAKVVTGGTILL